MSFTYRWLQPTVKDPHRKRALAQQCRTKVLVKSVSFIRWLKPTVIDNALTICNIYYLKEPFCLNCNSGYNSPGYYPGAALNQLPVRIIYQDLLARGSRCSESVLTISWLIYNSEV